MNKIKLPQRKTPDDSVTDGAKRLEFQRLDKSIRQNLRDFAIRLAELSSPKVFSELSEADKHCVEKLVRISDSIGQPQTDVLRAIQEIQQLLKDMQGEP